MTVHRIHRVLLATVFAAVFAMATGCARRDSLPTAPEGGITDIWTRLYPPSTNRNLHGVWAMDADDVWAVGQGGVIVHYDGQNVREVASPTAADLKAIDGCARDDIWAVGSMAILHFDGYAWRDVSTDAVSGLSTLCCRGPGDVFVMGEASTDSGTVVAVSHYDGVAWRDTGFPARHFYSSRVLWSPGPDYPLYAGTWTLVYYQDGVWTPCSPVVYPQAASGNRLLARFGGYTEVGLFEVDTSGGLHTLCGSGHLPPARYMVRSRDMLAGDSRGIWSIVSCDDEPSFLGSDVYLEALAAPVRPGPDGPAVYAVGRDALMLRGAWQPDHTLAWSQLGPGPTPTLGIDSFAGSGDRAYALTEDGRLARITSAGVTFDGAFIGLRELRGVADGRIAALTAGGSLIARDDDGPWETVVADVPTMTERYWTDGVSALFTTVFGACWAYEGGGLAPVDSLPAYCSWVDGYALDDLYATAMGGLRHFDGQHWQSVVGADSSFTLNAYASPFRNRVYIRGLDYDGRELEGHVSAGVFTANPSPGAPRWYDDAICEVAPDDLYCIGYDSGTSGLYRRRGDAWTPVASWERGATGMYGSAGLGLVVRDSYGEVSRTALPVGEEGARP